MKKKNKKECQQLHFIKRVRQRYDIECDMGLIRGIVAKIQRGESVFVERQSCRITVHDLYICGRGIRVVYDGLRKVPVTALWKEAA